jgi:hypothetical protein
MIGCHRDRSPCVISGDPFAYAPPKDASLRQPKLILVRVSIAAGIRNCPGQRPTPRTHPREHSRMHILTYCITLSSLEQITASHSDKHLIYTKTII